MFKNVRALDEGDLIDLTPAIEKFFPDLLEDISRFEYALVEDVEDFGLFVVVYTDQHNLSLPPNYSFELQEAEEYAFED